MSAVCICFSTSRFCTPHSWFVAVGKNSRSMSSVVISVSSAAHSNIIFGILDSSKECLSLLRPLLEILFLAREFLRTSKTFHIDETRSTFPNLGCGQQSCLYCGCNLDSCSILSFKSEQLLLKLNLLLLHRSRHRSSSG